jgi:phosphoglycolate phosphatase
MPSQGPATGRLAGLKALVFDFDGTLARLTINFALMRRRVVKLVRAAGVRDAELERLHVLELVEAAAAGLPPEGAASLRAKCAAAIEAVEFAGASRARLLPGVVKALDSLRREGIRVGVITRNCRRAVLTAAPHLLAHADALLARDDVPRTKPDPDHPLRCLSLIGADGTPAALVGDHTMDMETAHAAGLMSVGVLTGATGAADLRAAGAEAVFADVPALAAAILGGKRGPG